MIESSFLYVSSPDHFCFWIQPEHHLYISLGRFYCIFHWFYLTWKSAYQLANFSIVACFHRDVNKVSFSFHPSFFITKQRWFSGVVHNLPLFSTDFSYFFCKVEWVGQCFFWYRRIEIFYVENSKLIPIFLWNLKEPFYNFNCIFPLVNS